VNPKRAWLVLAAVLLAAATPAPTSGVKEVGNLVLDNLPDIPPAVVERANQYLNTRGARLLDWDADGAGMLIATRFGDVEQVHHVAAPGGYRQQLTFYREPVSAAEVDPARPGGFYFRSDAGGGEFYQYYWLDTKTGRRTLVTDGKSRNENLIVADAGGRYVVKSTRRNGTDFDIWVGEGVDPGSARLVKQLRGEWTPTDWSPDGKRLLLIHEISINEAYPFVLDVASGEMVEINAHDPGQRIGYAVGEGGAARFSRNGKGVYYSSDEGSEFLRLTYYDLASGKKQVLLPDLKWNVERLAVSRDGKWLAYTVNEGGSHSLYVGAPDHPERAKKVAVPPGVIERLHFDRGSRRLGFDESNSQTASDVFSVDLPGLKVTRWTFSEVGGLDPSSFVTPQLISYPSFDGKQIPAWIYRPHRRDKPAAVVIDIHGGPEAQEQPRFQAFYQYLLNELGVAVIAPNVRGSAGYGKTYLTLDDGFKREDSVKDIGALLDWIAQQPDLDAKRVAVYGGSYGGFMSLSVLYHYPERIRCGVDYVGISNLVTFLEHTESYRRDLRRVEYGDERDPKMREFQTRIAPLTNADKIRSPLFVIQGKNDPRVPASEADQMVQTVRKNGGAVWYLLAKDEGHGFQKKANRDVLYPAVGLFFEHFLLQ
jgi:dipeptidyl aminopeptidase/acylaminoacyl peptidase